MLGEDISLAISSKGVVQIHSLPNWNILVEKHMGKIIDGSLFNGNKLAILDSNAPSILDLNFVEIQKFRKPFMPLDVFNFTSFQVCDDIFYCTASNGNLFSYDSRTSENPTTVGLTGRPTLTSISANSETVLVSTDQGKIYIVDPRMNRTLSIIDLAPFSQSNQIIDGISRRDEAPWSLCFQFADGTSGIFDLMEQKEEIIIEPPPFTSCQKYSKLKPVFIGKYMIVGYSWSKTINVYKKHVKSTDLLDVPVAMATSPYIDGLFFSSYEGDVYQVF